MKKRFGIFILSIVIISIEISAQLTLPAERRGNWTTAGYSSTQRYIPRDFQDIWAVTSYGLQGDGTTNNSPALQTMIDSYISSGLSSVVFDFPAGTYVFHSNIVLDGINGIVFRGAGSDQTTFKYFCTYTISPVPPFLPVGTVGNLFDISNANNVGIENIRIQRDGYPSNGSCNIKLDGCTSCWIVGVESVKPMLHHIYINGGSHIVVKGCYLQDAEYFGDIGDGFYTHGYGVVLSGGTSQCLVEDNICRYLRHGIAFTHYANHNVADYNYVFEGHAYCEIGGFPTFYHEWDILCHGRGNNFNLFEGNVVDLMGADNDEAQSPYATFYRNIAFCSQGSADEDVRFGGVPYLNIVGNVVTKNNEILETKNEGCPNIYDVYGNISGTNNSHYNHTFINYCGGWDGGTNPCEVYYQLEDFSYYYTSDSLAPAKPYEGEAPGFWYSNITWPAIGPRYSGIAQFPLSQKNPAKWRVETFSKPTVDAPPLVSPQVILTEGQYISSGACACTYKVNGSNIGATWISRCLYERPITIEVVEPAETCFHKWSDGSIKNPRTLSILSDISLHAVFFRRYPIVTLNPGTIPEVSGNGGTYKVEDIDEGTSWSDILSLGQTIKIEAVSPADAVFFKWSDGNMENPRYLAPQDHITLNATYKKHLVSNHITPTKGNGQQRIASVFDTMEDIVVYESAGEIWVVVHYIGTDTWSPEVRLSDGLGGNSNPSIAARGELVSNQIYGDGIYVVWQKKISSNPDAYDVYMALRNTYSYCGNYGWITTRPADGLPIKVNSDYVTSSVPPKPVVTIHKPDNVTIEPVIVVYRKDGGTLQMRYTTVESGCFDGSFEPFIPPGLSLTSVAYPMNFPGMESGNFCLSQPEIEYGETVTLAYVDFSYSNYTYSLMTVDETYRLSGNTFVWSTPQKVPASDGNIALDGLSFSPSSWYGDFYETIGIYCPQVIRRYGKTCYAWIEYQAYDSPNVPFVVYQERNGSTWDPNVYVWDLLYLPNWNLLPSSVSLGEGLDETTLMWSIGNTSYKTVRPSSGGSWQTTEVLSNGYDLQMRYFGSAPNPLWAFTDNRFYLYTEPGSSYQSLRAPELGPLTKSIVAKSSEMESGPNDQVAVNSKSAVKTGIPVNVSYSRILSVTDTVEGTHLSITVSQPKLGNRMLSFNPINDILPDINAENCLEYLCSLPAIIGNTDDTLSFNIGIRYKSQQGREKKAMQLLVCDLKNAITSSKIASLASLTVDTKKGSNRYHIIKVPVKNYKGASLKTALSGIDLNKLGKNLQFLLIHVYKPEASDTTTMEKAITGTNLVPAEFGLQQNYPNPFNPSTTIEYSIPVKGMVKLQVYDILGRLIATLVDAVQDAGAYNVKWNGKTESAAALPSGVYFYRLQSGSFTKTGRMLLLK